MTAAAMPLPGATLLPANRTPWESAQSLVSAARRPLPADLVRAVWNPATCPADLLPYLAAGLGLELWRDSWPEARQREIIAGIWRLKRNKTKLKGIRAYLGLVDAALVSAHRPRDRFWWSGGQSQAQRDATSALMPRVRLFPVVKPIGGSPSKPFWGGRFVRQAWRAGRAWLGSDAATRYAGRASYVDGGTATPVTLRGIDGPLDASIQVELSAPASPARLFWGGGRAWGAAAYLASDAAHHILAITPDGAAPGFAVPRGLVPSTVRPVRTAETAPAPVTKLFWGRRFWDACAYLASDAADHVYDEVVLFDPARAAPSRQPTSFWGATRWGRPAYTAELLVDVALTRPAMAQGWGAPWGRRFWRRSDLTPFWDAVGATAIAKAVRDIVWIDTRLFAPIRFTQGLRFGEADFARFGDSRKAT